VGTTLTHTPAPERAQQAAPAGPPKDGAPPHAQPPEPAAARTCANCGATMQPAQDWCLQCGAGASGSLERTRPGWRSAGVVLGATAVLVLGAAAAGYAALSKEGSRPHVIRAIVAQAPTAPAVGTPSTIAPSTTTPATGATATTPLFGTTAKPPKIPITPLKLPKTATGAVPPVSSVTLPLPKTKPIVPVTPVTPAKPTKPSGSKGSGSTPSVTVAEPLLLDTNAAATYNPYSYPVSEFGDPSLAIDGDTSTEWTAQVNPAVAPKMAQGLVIDLKSPTRVAALELVSSTPGMTIQIYGANGQAPPTSITDPTWVKLSPSMVDKKRNTRISLKHSKTAYRFVTLWISRAPESQVGTPTAPGHVSVNELELFPPA
jgi:hypothetical protein